DVLLPQKSAPAYLGSTGLLMRKWLSPALLLCAVLIGAQFGGAQDSPQDNPGKTVAPESATLNSDDDSTPAVVPDPSAEGAAPDPLPFLSPTTPRQPSEWRIMGSQWKSIGPDLLHDQKSIYLF